jgi:Tol biopolymer transport system component
MLQDYNERGPKPPAVDPVMVRTCLNRILATPEFERAGRIRLLLDHLVRQSLDGHSDSLKESLIGVEVFGRAPGYDPKVEPVVRVTAGRLRAKLDAYYQREGLHDPVRIVIPKGTYVPAFEILTAANPAASSPDHPRRRSARLAIGAAIVVLAATATGLKLASSAVPPAFDNLRPFVTGKGAPTHPSFSPTGDTLAFEWSGPGDRFTNIYLQRLDSSVPVRFTHDQANTSWPVWSKDGREIAYLRQLTMVRMAIVSVPLTAAAERVWTEVERGDADRPRLDWSPDGNWFATAQRIDRIQSILLFSRSTGERRTLTRTPPGWRGDSEPVFTPDSKQVAFRRTQVASGVEDIYIVPLSGGEPRRLTFDNRPISALVFTPDGGLVFSSKRTGTIRGLWWLPPGGGPLRRLSSTAVDAGSPTVSRDGKHVAFVKVLFDTDVWRVSPEPGAAPAAMIASDLPDASAQYSPDGRRIAFQSSRDGAPEIWTCDANGANPIRLTNAGGAAIGFPQWSPDGQFIAFESYPKGRGEIHVVAAGGGPDRTLVAGAYDNVVPHWSADARAIYFGTNRAGRMQLWRVNFDDRAESLVIDDGYAALESRDGRTLYFTRRSGPGIWKAALLNGQPEGEPVKVLANARQDWGSAALGKNGIFYLELGGDFLIRYLDLATGQARTLFTPKNQPMWRGAELAVSPDEQTILYTVIERDGLNIFAR